jgi:hypothetical protein
MSKKRNEPELIEDLPSTRKLPDVPLSVYITAGGRKWDQLAGFEFYAKSTGLAPMSMVEWEAAFRAFEQRPVGV